MNLGTEYNNNEQQIVQILFWTTNEPLKVQYTHSEKHFLLITTIVKKHNKNIF